MSEIEPHTWPANDVLVPAAHTPVLLNRELRPGTDPTTISRFAENRWDLTPAIHEAHYKSISLNFDLVPTAFRHVAKVYAWMELNYDQDLVSLRRSGVDGPGAVYTMRYRMLYVRRFLEWLAENGIAALTDVTHNDLDRYLDAVRDCDTGVRNRGHLLTGVRRLWAFRDLLPPNGRLPQAPPWKGKDNRILLGRPRYDLENRTQRIPETTMSALLCWALRFVEDFSADILAALTEYRPLVGRTGSRTTLAENAQTTSTKGKAAWLTAAIDTLLDDHRRGGQPLPGRLLPGGATEPDWMHLARMIGCGHGVFTRRSNSYSDRILDSGLPIADAAYLRCQLRGMLDGRQWQQQIRYDQVPQLVRALHTACFILLAYLSGMRPGEVLSLERGCVTHDPRSGLWQVTGREWKGVADATGVKIPEGQLREDPWIVIEPVARAVAVLEQVHDSPLLFPVSILAAKTSDRAHGAKASSTITEDLQLFTDWVNTYCRSRGRVDGIPVPAERITSSRFRRTLAWFICRRPRGLVAAAIQYGHVHVQITQGYSGSYASGFPDELAFERWLARLDELDEADRQLNTGGHVSGPAADAYRARVAGGAGRFAGRVIRSGKHARHILANPSLQIYPGTGMTCVFNAATALCELTPSHDDARTTPDTDDCRAACRNIARTDDDIAQIATEAATLRAVTDDPASPPIRLARERQRLTHLDRILTAHQSSRPDTEAQP